MAVSQSMDNRRQKNVNVCVRVCICDFFLVVLKRKKRHQFSIFQISLNLALKIQRLLGGTGELNWPKICVSVCFCTSECVRETNSMCVSVCVPQLHIW